MDTLVTYREIIKKILKEHSLIPYRYGEVTTEVVFDGENDRYLMVDVGWERGKRVHDCIVHVDIIDDKIWIQYDGTEEGIACELTRAGVPNKKLCWGFVLPIFVPIQITRSRKSFNIPLKAKELL